MDLETLQILFDIGKVEYWTVHKLSPRSGSKYLNRFLRKNLKETDIDKFLVNNRNIMKFDSLMKQIIEDFGIILPEVNFWREGQVAELRKTDRKFGRNVTLSIMKTWH